MTRAMTRPDTGCRCPACAKIVATAPAATMAATATARLRLSGRHVWNMVVSILIRRDPRAQGKAGPMGLVAGRLFAQMPRQRIGELVSDDRSSRSGSE